jgi:ubiquitin-like protein Pup
MARFVGESRRLPIYSAQADDAKQKHKQKPEDGKGGDEAAGSDGPKKMAKKGDELKEDMDALVDEIDAVLEENAEEFVKNYVQRGGQ